MQGTAFVFINRQQAVRFGHVGWGFSLNEEQSDFYFGSTDHLYRHRWWDLPGWVRYAHVQADSGINLDWWGTTGSYDQMLSNMREGHHICYHSLCAMKVADANPEAAVAFAQSLSTSGWSALSNNCVHQAYKVLSKYGAGLPTPAEPLSNLIPKVWYARLEGCRQALL